MANITTTFSADNGLEGDDSEWNNAANAWDGNQATYTDVTPSNGLWDTGQLRVSWSGSLGALNDNISKVEIGVRAKATNTVDNLLVVFPILRTDYYQSKHFLEYRPGLTIDNRWRDITDFIDDGQLETTWTKSELEKMYVEIYPINQFIFQQNTFNLYEVYLRVTYSGSGTVSETTTGNFTMYNPGVVDKVNGTYSVSTSGTFSMNDTSTPDGDDWFDYSNDGFFNQSVESFWTQSLTTSGSLTEGKHYLRINSGAGTTVSGNGIYQTIASGTTFDIRMKVVNSDFDNSLSNNGVGLMVKVDDNDYMAVIAKKNVIGYRWEYFRTIPGVAGGFGGNAAGADVEYRELPYYFRITSSGGDITYGAPWNTTVTYNDVTSYFSLDGEDWELMAQEKIERGDKNIWVTANHNNGTPFYADIDWFGGTDRYIPDRFAVSTLDMFTVSGTTTSGA